MKYTTSIIALASIASAQYSDSSDPLGGTYGDNICMPMNSSHVPDPNAPCNAVAYIEAQCVYGPGALQSLYGDGNTKRKRSINSLARRQVDSGDDIGNMPEQSNSTQRDCVCQSQFFNQVSGCVDCFVAHGGDAYDNVGLGQDQISSLSSSYCAASSTPTLDLPDFLYQFADSVPTPSASASSSKFHDPLGNQTAVSLYFTPSVTGTAAYLVADATSGSSSGKKTSSASTDKSGQIVPTATANNAAAQKSGGNDGSSTSSGLAAGKTQAAAAAGLIGIAGLAAFL